MGELYPRDRIQAGLQEERYPPLLTSRTPIIIHVPAEVQRGDTLGKHSDLTIQYGKTKRLRINLAFLLVVTLLLSVAKLLGVIDWSWLWVLSPLWLPVFVVVSGLTLLAAILIMFEGAMFLLEFLSPRKR